MNKTSFITQLLQACNKTPIKPSATVYAPANIALVKYWGKRDNELNLPVTSSLSISLADKGTSTTLSVAHQAADEVFLNGEKLTAVSPFVTRLLSFLDLFRPRKDFYFRIETISTVPIAAGLASSASGFAALVLALNDWLGWALDLQSLSLLARMGSGSAARSLWHGFVMWQGGERDDGMDSFAYSLSYQWPSLRLGLLIHSTAEKHMSSRDGMIQTVQTSPLYTAWPAVVA